MIYSKSEIAILMATYNGEKYLGEQIDSILAQTYHDWHLYIHDDGSKDGTLSIIQEYVLNHPDKITLFDYPSQGGACKNFLSLLERVEAPYYMFCDQDDVWLPEKIEKKYAKIRELEKENHHTPIVVYSDLIVTDSNLNTISPSLWNIAGIYPEFVKSFDEMAANTLMSGCAMLFNHDAKITVPPIKENITMHDAWIACCVAKQNGILYPIKQPTIFYRQHSANALGAQDVRNPTLIKRINKKASIISQFDTSFLLFNRLLSIYFL
jgi:glycosyltransferase involved in cell wall biosynthesis